MAVVQGSSRKQWEIEITSSKGFLDFTEENPNLFIKIAMRDDIFKFYPICEFYYRDTHAIVSEHICFVEGLKWKFKIGNSEDKYIESNWVWTENQLVDTEIAEHLSGSNYFVFLQEYYIKDRKQSRAWKDTIENVVKDIMKKDFGLSDKDKLFISSTVGKDYWYQCNVTNKDFLNSLTKRAYSTGSVGSNKSPSLTFINRADEFYFMTISEMMAQQPLKDLEYTITYDRHGSDKDSINNYFTKFLGAPRNKLNYKIKVYATKNDGTTETKDLDIKDYIIKNSGKGKLLVPKDNQKDMRNAYFGIKEKSDTESFKAWQNNLFIRSVLTYRMVIVVDYHRKLVAGKVIKVTINSSDPDIGVSKEFSGNWLIIGTELLITAQDGGVPSIQLTIGKGTIDINKKHKYFNDFIS